MFRRPIGEDAELRLLEERHADALFALTDQNRQYLREWLPWLDGVKAVEDTRAFIKGALEQLASNRGFQVGIWYRGELAGVIGFHYIDWAYRRTEIGYWVGEVYQGKGLVTRSCNALVDYAFNELGLNRVEILCATENHKSRAIPERLGFTQEGTLRQAQWFYDHFVDLVVYGMLARQWRSSP